MVPFPAVSAPFGLNAPFVAVIATVGIAKCTECGAIRAKSGERMIHRDKVIGERGIMFFRLALRLQGKGLWKLSRVQRVSPNRGQRRFSTKEGLV